MAKSFNTAGPGYLAFIPGGGLPTAALADYGALSVNRYVGVHRTGPGRHRGHHRGLAGGPDEPSGCARKSAIFLAEAPR